MPKLLMLKGLPASGKSTYAKELVAKGWKRVNKDDLRAMIDESKWSKKNEAMIVEIRNLVVQRALYNMFNVVVDDTNFHPEHEKDLREFAKVHGAEFEVKFFDVPLKECIERDAKRGDKSVGKKVIQGMYRQYLEPNLPKVEHNLSLPDAYIFDIDGTLAQMTDRSPYDYTRVSTDEVKTDVAAILDQLVQCGKKIIIMSGRNMSCIEDTKKWLEDNSIKYDALFMRHEDDKRKDCIVKKELYEQGVKGKYNILGVYDDRNQVVEMWREQGLTCFQVADGDF